MTRDKIEMIAGDVCAILAGLEAFFGRRWEYAILFAVLAVLFELRARRY